MAGDKEGAEESFIRSPPASRHWLGGALSSFFFFPFSCFKWETEGAKNAINDTIPDGGRQRR